MKKFLTCFAIIVVFSLIGGNAMADWNNWFFRSKRYKDQIKVEAYLMNKDQLCPLINDDKATQLNYDKLSLDIYLVVRLKNGGHKAAWGTLLCKIEDREVKVYIPSLPVNMQNYAVFIVYKGGVIPRNTLSPQISVDWEELYSK